MGSWRILVPAFLLFLCACLALPLGAGLVLRAQSGGETAGIGALIGGSGGDAWIGIRMQNVPSEYAQAFNLRDTNGILISSVFPKSPAEKGGLESGDIIVQWNGQSITNLEAAQPILSKLQPNETIKLGVIRPERAGPERLTLDVLSGVRPGAGDVRTWQTYQVRGVPFQLKYPDHWLVDGDESPPATIVFVPPTRFDDVVQIRVTERAPALDDWAKQLIDSNTSTRDFELLDQLKITVGGQDARRLNLSLTTEDGDKQRVSLVLVKGTGTRGYFMLLSTDPSTYPALVRVFDEMVQSFTPER